VIGRINREVFVNQVKKKTVPDSQKTHRPNYKDQSMNVSEIIPVCPDRQTKRLNGIPLGKNAKEESSSCLNRLDTCLPTFLPEEGNGWVCRNVVLA